MSTAITPNLERAHASRGRGPSYRGTASGEEYFLPPHFMRRSLEVERSRSDRVGGEFCLLLLAAEGDDIDRLVPVLQGRLRMTDVPGLWHDGRVALLLPDTRRVGAERLAHDVLSSLTPSMVLPRWEVLVHPGEDLCGGAGWHTSGEDGTPEDPPPGGPAGGDTLVLDDDTQTEIKSYSRGGVEGVSPMQGVLLPKLPLWKRSMDVAGALVGLTLSAPVILAAALAIKLTSPGPVFFRQQRDGLGGRRFWILKLRTMVVEADKQKKALAALNERDGPAFKMARDPRVTRVGRFLRSTSLDELPQFWNVLRGEMSLVGPRPLPSDESLLCERWQKVRLHTVPGLTCTWQVSGRAGISFDDWARMDLRYIRGLSLWTDIQLLLRTFKTVLTRDGSH